MNRVIESDVEVANMALRMVQCPDIQSMDDGSSTARTVKMYYHTVLANCLSMYEWSFGRRCEEMQELSECPLAQYKHAYKLPLDVISIVRLVGEGGIVRRYEVISGDIVCTDTPPPVRMEYTYCPPVRYLPAYFIDLFVHALVEELSAVFGYNIEGQRVFHERIRGRGGKFSAAIACERMNGGGSERGWGHGWCHDHIGWSRRW